MTRRFPAPLALGGALLLTAALTAGALAVQPVAGAATSQAATEQALAVGPVRTVTSGVKLPWGVAFLPDRSDHWLYVYHTSSSDNRIVRIKYENDKLGTKETLVTGIPRSKYHNGGRIAFGPDGNLYASTGDAQNKPNAQNLNSLGGKILRMTPDGKPAAGNPFAGKVIYSYGHRNVQGLGWDSQRRLWASELGDGSKDELNLVKAGGNYGWPACEGKCDDAKYVNPVREWNVADASPSGIAIVDDVIYMACLRGTRMYEMKISGSTTSTPKAHFNGVYGRLRTIVRNPDGDLWVATSNGSDQILNVGLS